MFFLFLRCLQVLSYSIIHSKIYKRYSCSRKVFQQPPIDLQTPLKLAGDGLSSHPYRNPIAVRLLYADDASGEILCENICFASPLGTQ